MTSTDVTCHGESSGVRLPSSARCGTWLARATCRAVAPRTSMDANLQPGLSGVRPIKLARDHGKLNALKPRFKATRAEIWTSMGARKALASSGARPTKHANAPGRWSVRSLLRMGETSTSTVARGLPVTGGVRPTKPANARLRFRARLRHRVQTISTNKQTTSFGWYPWKSSFLLPEGYH